MKKSWKIILPITIGVIIIGGLFLLRTYYSGLYGIDADIASEIKLLGEKSVPDGDFESANDQDQLTGLVRAGDGYVIKQKEAEKVCGNAPEQTILEDFEVDPVTINLEEIDIPEDRELNQMYPNYYLDGEIKNVSQDNQFDINPVQLEENYSEVGFSIYRGPGWLAVQLNRTPEGSDILFSGAKGTITLPDGVSLSEDAIVNYNAEKINDGEVGWDSLNDEVSLDRENNKVNFTLITSDGFDKFYVNYCLDQTQENVGGIRGKIDLGSEFKINNMKLNLGNYLKQDRVEIKAILSKEDLSQWDNSIDPVVSNSNSIDLSGFSDNKCYQYVNYLIKLASDYDPEREPLKFKGLEVYGQDCPTDQNNESVAVKLISTGSSFWILIVLVIVIVGIVVYYLSRRKE
jgi:hypothetical protein